MPVRSFVVTGADGPLTRSLRERLEPLGPVRVDTTLRSGPMPAGCDTLIDLGWETRPARPLAPGGLPFAVADRRSLLDAAASGGITTLVHVSSAIVYGAWSDNAIPLTEDAPLRPNPGLAEAVAYAERERLVADWADDHPAVKVCVLRPAVVLGPGVVSWLGRALSNRAPLRPVHLDPPRQFVHVDDLADAVSLAASARLDGVYNVAPDGWIGGEQARVLGAGGPTLAVPSRIASAAAAVSWRLHLSSLAPDVVPLVEQPWVIANDRLRAVGWAPSYTNEEAVVAGTSASRWREMSSSRRQEVALGGMGAALIAGGVAIGLIRRRGRTAG